MPHVFQKSSGLSVCLLALTPDLPSQSYRLQSMDLACGGPVVFGETVTIAGPSPFTVAVSATSPIGVFHVLCIDFAARCTPFTPPSGAVMANRNNALGTDPTGLLSVIPASGPWSFTYEYPNAPGLLNLPTVVQFLRYAFACPPLTPGCAAGAWDYGPSHDVVLTQLPVPRGAHLPSQAERDVYGERDLPWDPIAAGTTRYARLQTFATGQLVLTNGAPLWVDDGSVMGNAVSDPRLVPAAWPPIAHLAELVQRRWHHLGYQLRMTSAKRPPSGTEASYHQYGRAVDLTLADAAGMRVAPGGALYLDQLARLAAEPI